MTDSKKKNLPYPSPNYETLGISPFSLEPCDCVTTPFAPADTLFVCHEMGMYPFFLVNNSALVRESRKGYANFVLARQMLRKKISVDLIREKTSFTSSPVDRMVSIPLAPLDPDIFSPPGPPPCSETPSEGGPGADISLNLYNYGKWSIHAHPDYGFPNEIDGWYWDYILNLISSTYELTNTFAFIYYLKPSDMIRYRLSNCGIKVGDKIPSKYYQELYDCLERLKVTTFSHVKGHKFKPSNSFLHHAQYKFSLISSIYAKGTVLPNKSVAYQFAVALDPMFVENFRSRFHLITLNKYRAQIRSISGKSLFDRLSLLCLNSLVHGEGEISDFSFFNYFNIPFFVIINYNRLCSFLGYSVVNELKPTKIRRQFSEQFNALYAENVISAIYFDRHNMSKSYNLIFVLSPSFVDNVCSISSNFRVQPDISPSVKERKTFMDKISSLINEKKTRSCLFQDVRTVGV